MTHVTSDGRGEVRVVLASASAVRRAGLEVIVRSAPQLRLNGSFQGTNTATQRAMKSGADVLLADLENESSLSFDHAGAIASVVLIDQPDPAWTALAVRSGVKSILGRDSGRDEIVPAIMAAYAGFILLDREIGLQLASQGSVRKWQPHLEETEMAEDLTPREQEVLGMLAEGLGNRDIAHRLGVSDHTIKFHISSILDKLGAATRTEAVTIGLRLGLILL